METVCLACCFADAKAFWDGTRWHLVTVLGAALFLSIISIPAQVLYLELDALKGAAHIPPGVLDGVPLIGWLVGNNSGGSRRAGPSDWVPRRRGSVLLCAGEIDRESGETDAGDAAGAAGEACGAALERRIFEQAFAAFDQVEQQLGAPVEVQALPAAGQTGEAAQAAKAGHAGAKPITAQFQTLDASQAAESEGSSNGHRSFRRQR